MELFPRAESSSSLISGQAIYQNERPEEAAGWRVGVISGFVVSNVIISGIKLCTGPFLCNLLPTSKSAPEDSCENILEHSSVTEA